VSARRIVHFEQAREDARRLASSGLKLKALRMSAAAGDRRGRAAG